MHYKTVQSNYVYEDLTSGVRLILNIFGVLFLLTAILTFYYFLFIVLIPIDMAFFCIAFNLKITEKNYNMLKLLDLDNNLENALEKHKRLYNIVKKPFKNRGLLRYIVYFVNNAYFISLLYY